MKRTKDGTRLMVAANADMLYALVIPSGVEESLIREETYALHRTLC